jgi:hypothetical protein
MTRDEKLLKLLLFTQTTNFIWEQKVLGHQRQLRSPQVLLPDFIISIQQPFSHTLLAKSWLANMRPTVKVFAALGNLNIFNHIICL